MEKTKLFTTQQSFVTFINGVLLNICDISFEERNAYAHGFLYKSKDINAKLYKIMSMSDAYSKDGFSHQGIEIQGPVIFVYKLFNSLNDLNSTVQRFCELMPDGVTYVFIIYGLWEDEIRESAILPDNVLCFANETVERWINEYPLDYIKSQDLIRLYNNTKVNKFEIDDFINYNKYVVDKLKNDIDDGDLSIILGAGVSFDYGAVSWNKLVNSFEKDISEKISLNFDNQIKGKIGTTDLIHAQLYKDLLPNDKYYNRIYQSLYGNFTSSKLKKATTLFELGSLLKRYFSNRNIKVLTYNYDNFFEQYLDKYFSNIKYSVFFTEECSLNNSIPIYHIHGYLPYDKEINKNDKEINKNYKESIKLTEDDYNFLYNSPYSWQIETQLEAFRKNNCLFVGCSLTDPNIRRLLKLSIDSKKRHYAIMSIDKMNTFELVIVSHHFSKLGVDIIWTKDFNEFPTVLKQL